MHGWNRVERAVNNGRSVDEHGVKMLRRRRGCGCAGRGGGGGASRCKTHETSHHEAQEDRFIADSFALHFRSHANLAFGRADVNLSVAQMPLTQLRVKASAKFVGRPGERRSKRLLKRVDI